MFISLQKGNLPLGRGFANLTKGDFPGFEGPYTEHQIQQAARDEMVILWRGTNVQNATAIGTNLTAGGAGSANLSCGSPTEEEARMQVGGYSGYGYRKQPEYTTNYKIAQQFARGAIICIWIKKMYLTKGSGSEGGWIAYPNAPLEQIYWTKYGDPHAARIPNAD